MFTWLGARDGVYEFAIERERRDVRLRVPLAADPPAAPPAVVARSAAGEIRCTVEPASPAGRFDVWLDVPDPGANASDTESAFTLGGDGLPDCAVVLRRSGCAIGTALIERDGERPLDAQTRAALLWHGFDRYAELVALRRFTSGKSGGDVLVFRPRIIAPRRADPSFGDPGALELLGHSWGSPILVKTGDRADVREEWERFHLFLLDRLHPFMARSEAFLATRAPGDADRGPDRATLIGSFVGGDLVRAESFESLLRQPAEPEEIERVLERIFRVTGTWYATSAEESLGAWTYMFGRPDASGSARRRLFDRIDLADAADRRRLGEALGWDVAFSDRAHLVDHLLGTGGEGLLPRLARLPVRFSLIHGDLHCRNVLVEDGNVTLFDWGGTGVAPTLADFATLEVFVRLWCLDLDPSAARIEEAAAQLETLLVDHLTATEGSMEPIRALAADMGVAGDDLMRAARTIAAIRRAARPYFLGSPDRRDYLGVLYLAVFRCVRHAKPAEPLGNFRWLMALYWVLEDALSRIVGLAPFPRRRAPVTAARLLGRTWLAAPGAPGRVRYWLEHPEGARALPALAATRGVLQGDLHHLDVLDHTLLTVAYLEAILDDPARALSDPRSLDGPVHESLRQQGIEVPPVGDAVPFAGAAPAPRAALPRRLNAILDDETRLIMKWAALLHDVGKPATRVLTRRNGGEEIDFPGQEIYGWQLVEPQVRALFGDGPALQLMRYLHLAQRLPDRAAHRHARLDHRDGTGVSVEAPPEIRERALPALLLLGLADRFATRGPAAAPSLEHWVRAIQSQSLLPS